MQHILYTRYLTMLHDAFMRKDMNSYSLAANGLHMLEARHAL